MRGKQGNERGANQLFPLPTSLPSRSKVTGDLSAYTSSEIASGERAGRVQIYK